MDLVPTILSFIQRLQNVTPSSSNMFNIHLTHTTIWMIPSVKINFKLALFYYNCYSFLLLTLFCREKDNPSPDLRYQCTRMSLLLSEDHAWESTLCNEATAAVGVCQYEWQSGIYIYIYHMTSRLGVK